MEESRTFGRALRILKKNMPTTRLLLINRKDPRKISLRQNSIFH